MSAKKLRYGVNYGLMNIDDLPLPTQEEKISGFDFVGVAFSYKLPYIHKAMNFPFQKVEVYASLFSRAITYVYIQFI